jgi:hypothetical protein
MTEDEAKTKWCPFARTLGTLTKPAYLNGPDVVTAQGSANRGYAMGGALHNCMCIGSACMAWRLDPALVPWVNEKGELSQIEGRYPTSGHCGLAGKP